MGLSCDLMDEFYTLIANVGFPIAVAAYLLLRMEAKLDLLTVAISRLTESLPKKEANT